MLSVPGVLPVMTASIVVDAFRQADGFGKIVVGGLGLLSMYTWAVMIGKGTDLGGIRHHHRIFLRFYRGTAHPAMAHLGERKLPQTLPLAAIYTAATRELLSTLYRTGVTDETLRAWHAGEVGTRLSLSELAGVRSTAERCLAEQQLLVEQRMSLIATATTAAPSLGLLGTVWGVMVAFMAMGAGGPTVLSAVAPGISGALLTTVVGLTVAIPSAVGYNLLADKVREIVVEMENFVDEYMADVARVHGVGGGGV